jgi:hypothetical protein
MRDASQAARLEDAGAGCDLDNPTVRIADAHEAMPTPPDATGDARQQYRPNHGRKKPTEQFRDGLKGTLGLRRRQGYSLVDPVWVGG